MIGKLRADQNRIVLADETDWRLTGQEKYLSGASLCSRRFSRPVDGDHAHCEFCWAKFMDEDHPADPEILHDGYVTGDSDRWVCDNCFADFRERFLWTLFAG